jgi:hypothetical protein
MRAGLGRLAGCKNCDEATNGAEAAVAAPRAGGGGHALRGQGGEQQQQQLAAVEKARFELVKSRAVSRVVALKRIAEQEAVVKELQQRIAAAT